MPFVLSVLHVAAGGAPSAAVGAEELAVGAAQAAAETEPLVGAPRGRLSRDPMTSAVVQPLVVLPAAVSPVFVLQVVPHVFVLQAVLDVAVLQVVPDVVELLETDLHVDPWGVQLVMGLVVTAQAAWVKRLDDGMVGEGLVRGLKNQLGVGEQMVAVLGERLAGELVGQVVVLLVQGVVGLVVVPVAEGVVR